MTDTSNIAVLPRAQAPRERSTESSALLRRRYRSEARFRSYGVIAVVITAVFLVALIADILRTGLPAFWQHSVVLDTNLAADVIDPSGKRSTDALSAADYTPLVRAALASAIPGIEGRTQKKQLNEILSTGAADIARSTVLADPSLIGRSVKLSLLLSDNADLYLKGSDTKVSSRSNTRGIATPSGTSGEITVLTSANDFADELTGVKLDLAKRSEELKREAERLKARTGDAANDKVAEMRAEAAELTERFAKPAVSETLDGRVPSRLVAINGGVVKITSLGNSEIKGEVLIPLTSSNEAAPGTWQIVTYETPEGARNIGDRPVAFLEKLKADGRIERGFNWMFFTAGDSREPELAGIRGALVGSVLTLGITLLVCLPLGVMAAIYLEKYAPKNRVTDFIEININNLAAVPSIVFGLLGLAVFLNFFGLPRSAPLVGGLVLGLLVMPTIIIAARAALRAVPPSIEEAALGVGASKLQAIFHHVLPLATPGIMTGTIIGMAHALGETAPLLMIGMIAFIVDVPKSVTEAATVLPVQIYLWSDLPEPSFQAKTAAAIIVLLAVLFLLNGTAIWLRKKFETRW